MSRAAWASRKKHPNFITESSDTFSPRWSSSDIHHGCPQFIHQKSKIRSATTDHVIDVIIVESTVFHPATARPLLLEVKKWRIERTPDGECRAHVSSTNSRSPLAVKATISEGAPVALRATFSAFCTQPREAGGGNRSMKASCSNTTRSAPYPAPLPVPYTRCLFRDFRRLFDLRLPRTFLRRRRLLGLVGALFLGRSRSLCPAFNRSTAVGKESSTTGLGTNSLNHRA